MSKEPDFKYECGSVLKDEITGFKGVVIARTQWLANCNVYKLQPQGLKKGEPQDSYSFDEPHLVLVKDTIFEPKRDTGGPTDQVKKTNR